MFLHNAIWFAQDSKTTTTNMNVPIEGRDAQISDYDRI